MRKFYSFPLAIAGLRREYLLTERKVALPRPNDEMRAAIEKFILQRNNACCSEEFKGLQAASEKFGLGVEY